MPDPTPVPDFTPSDQVRFPGAHPTTTPSHVGTGAAPPAEVRAPARPVQAYIGKSHYRGVISKCVVEDLHEFSANDPVVVLPAATYAAQQAELKALREALEPFANQATYLNPEIPSTDGIGWKKGPEGAACLLRVQHLRAARAALALVGEGEEADDFPDFRPDLNCGYCYGTGWTDDPISGKCECSCLDREESQAAASGVETGVVE